MIDDLAVGNRDRVRREHAEIGQVVSDDALKIREICQAFRLINFDGSGLQQAIDVRIRIARTV